MTRMPSSDCQTLALGYSVSDDLLKKIKSTFKTVHHHPDGKFPSEIAGEVEVWAVGWGSMKGFKSVDEIPKTRLIQLMSAGANGPMDSGFLKETKGWEKKFDLCTASGIHSLSIPQYIVYQAINLFGTYYMQTYLLRSENKWVNKRTMKEKAAMSLYHKTAGMLGYGSIGRETARQLKAMNCRIIAANSKGVKTPDDGFIFPGTGDPDGSIPDKFYSASDEKSFKEFLSQCDILVASLPSTPQTTYLLNKEHFLSMPDRSVFINVGRGTLARSEDILAALDAPTGLWAVGLDVTDPEPLTDGSPLFSHDRAVITPHSSGDYELYNDSAAELMMQNVERIRNGKGAFNTVDPARGY